MPNSSCSACGRNIVWTWEEAFDKFGYGDGANGFLTGKVVDVLRRAGYSAEVGGYMLHNTTIDSITRDGVELIPEAARVGYDDPREYLPAAIVELLDEKLPDGEVVA